MSEQLNMISEEELSIKMEQFKTLFAHNKENQDFITTLISESEHQTHTYNSQMKALFDVRDVIKSITLQINASEAMLSECKVPENSEGSIDDAITVLTQLELKVKAMKNLKLQLEEMLILSNNKQQEKIRKMEQMVVKMQQEVETEEAIISQPRKEECELDNQLKEANNRNRELLMTLRDKEDHILALTKKKSDGIEEMAKEELYYSGEIEKKKTAALQEVNAK